MFYFNFQHNIDKFLSDTNRNCSNMIPLKNKQFHNKDYSPPPLPNHSQRRFKGVGVGKIDIFLRIDTPFTDL